MITVAEVQALIQQRITPLTARESVPLGQALGLVCASNIVSEIDIPPHANSAMDGFAVAAADLATQSTLAVSQRIPAGVAPAPLVRGTAARIFTGGEIPAGADAVVIQENCDYDEERVTVLQSVSPGANIRPQGQDIAQGAIVVTQGKRLNAIDLSLLASVGRAELDVFRPLRVAILSTGDELVDPGQPLKPGQIYNSNRVLLACLCRQMGYQVIETRCVADTLAHTTSALLDAAASADVILSSGGVSVGEEDHVRPAVEATGELELWKVQMKPGKPVAFGRVADTPFLGLPGNPVSAFVVFQLLATVLLRARQGQTSTSLVAMKVVADFSRPVTTREDYLRVQLVSTANGQTVARPFANMSSGVMSSLSWADGLVRQPIDQAINVGDTVDFLPIREAML
ncbi:molybdopterin molybdenumtransferase MoeA [Arenicella chitinivorans]|uniref:Molybdopterin molybdenumtransferase n=1 Tax=Arenicella chitinivorans TaxID=1329800 RepID=A0A918RNQ4_9GAMM|nr:gephyrin-like molybdotransferase Glp [Arenicella chitinivorans]GHA07055.1 molybdopterin molybdenumtransferase MoeA [Arenicella chitinivorans]